MANKKIKNIYIYIYIYIYSIYIYIYTMCVSLCVREYGKTGTIMHVLSNALTSDLHKDTLFKDKKQIIFNRAKKCNIVKSVNK